MPTVRMASVFSNHQSTLYFTRPSATVRQQTHEVDIAAREHVMATIQHPIIFDQYNICTMAEEDTLKHLKVALLQVICKGLNLSIPHPHLELLKRRHQ